MTLHRTDLSFSVPGLLIHRQLQCSFFPSLSQISHACSCICGLSGWTVWSSLVLGPQFTCQGCNSSTWKNDCLYLDSGILFREDYFSYIAQLVLKNIILNDFKLLNTSGQCFGVQHKLCKAQEISEGHSMSGQVISDMDRKRGCTSEHASPFAAIKLERQSCMGNNPLCALSVP